jgi:hypothetical protein
MRALLLLVLAAPVLGEEITPIPVLLKDKPAFDKKFSCVSGKTSTLFTKVSRHGHSYFTVWIGEGNERLKVFGYGAPTFKEGETIEACGVFSIQHTHSSRVFYDELSAKVILREGEIGKGRVLLTPTDAKLLPAKS